MMLPKSFRKEQERLQNEAQFASLNEQQQALVTRLALSSPWLRDWLKLQQDWNKVLGYFENEEVDVLDIQSCCDNWSLDDEALVMRDLRLWRNRHIARLIARDIMGLSDVQQTARMVSDLADQALKVALQWSAAYWRAKDGEPALCPYSGEPQQLIILAMGKHGARELNLSSDIDLIFAFPSAGVTAKGRSHEEFFTRVGRKMNHLLDARTSDGFVFRVDMRLRPWGQSGALVSNLKAMENYYLQQGRFWERFAMVKARPVTGHKLAQQALADVLHPFVYRRYVDYQAVGALRDLKTKIQTEVRRQNLDRNIKLGAGGIREVEFVAQVFQLIRGGQDEELQSRGTWPVLNALKTLELLPESVVNELIVAYNYLRDLEHRIQAIRDEQTQTLPSDEVDLERLVLSKGLDSVEQMMTELASVRATVQEHFSHLISEQHQPADDSRYRPFQLAWQVGKVGAEFDNSLAEQFFAFKQMPSVARLTGVAAHNLDEFIPKFWAELARHPDGAQRFTAILPILESILRRTSYFTLLAENPVAIVELVKLVPASEWIAQTLKDKPFLLDELTDKSSLYELPNRRELMDELHQQLLRVPEDDLERQMELLRHFRHGRVLRAAACEVSNHLPLMKISDYLAWVAEVVVEQSLALVWRQMVTRHGRPSKEGGDWCDPDFGVIAYGKMGGLELSYESDLDLVFLHNATSQGSTEGPKVIENVVFMARLGQKLIHLLSSVTPSGMLYEVDTRLRPSGNSGLLVSHMAGFRKYQEDAAWTWEHQALVRARFIAGDTAIKEAFDRYREGIICRQRDLAALRKDVIDMRQKMVDHLSSGADSSKDAPVFHLKHDRGGIVDLEFLVQFLILANAHQNPELARWSDNVRSIETLFSAGVISQDQKQQWLDAYLALREQVHHAILSGQSTKIPLAELTPQLVAVRERLKDAWLQYLHDS